MYKTQDSKPYALRERTKQSAKRAGECLKNSPERSVSIEDAKQLVKFPGSVGAGYIETGEALSKKDFAARIKISGKETKGE